MSNAFCLATSSVVACKVILEEYVLLAITWGPSSELVLGANPPPTGALPPRPDSDEPPLHQVIQIQIETVHEFNIGQEGRGHEQVPNTGLVKHEPKKTGQ